MKHKGTKVIHLDDDVHALAKLAAKERGDSMSHWLEELIKTEVKRKRFDAMLAKVREANEAAAGAPKKQVRVERGEP